MDEDYFGMSKEFLQMRLAMFVAIGIFAVLMTLVIHELGHALGAKLVGGELTALRLWGFTVFPEFSYTGFGGGFLGYTNWSLPTYSPTKNAVILMMGSGSTLLVSLLFIKLLYVLKPKSFVFETILLFFALTYLDIVTYSFGLRFSGHSEPLNAALTLGISNGVWKAAMIVLFVVCTGAIAFYYIRKFRKMYLESRSMYEASEGDYVD